MDSIKNEKFLGIFQKLIDKAKKFANLAKMNKFQKSVELARALFNPNKHEPRCFVASFGWYKNRIIGIGINSIKSNPINLRNPLFCRRTGNFIEKTSSCAELMLFLKIKNTTNIDFDKISITNVRLTRDGKIGNSKPCNSCESLCRFLKPRNLFYTLDSNFECPIFQQYYEF